MGGDRDGVGGCFDRVDEGRIGGAERAICLEDL